MVEVVSPSTRRRDYEKKRELYMAQAIAEYWIVEDDTRTITVVQPGRDPVTAADAVTWAPGAASAPLTFPLSRVFG